MQSEAGPVIGEESHPPISWSAIVAGAVAALALSATLTGLAVGFSLLAGPPSAVADGPDRAFTATAGAAVVAIQALSFALGGYLAGRLRTKWRYVHDHEVFFRDTAHGLLVWASATAAGLTVMSGRGLIPAVFAVTRLDPDVSGGASLFVAFGLLMGAFVAAVAAAIGGMRRDDMHARYRRAGGPTAI